MSKTNEASRFKTVVADGMECLEIAGHLVCTTDLVVSDEIIDNDFIRLDPRYGQYFSYEAAVVHSGNQGLVVPAVGEWIEIISAINPKINFRAGWQNDMLVRTTLGLKLAGFLPRLSVSAHNQGSNGFYWITSPTSVHAHSVCISHAQMLPMCNTDWTSMMLARCLKR